ncbi:MAG: metal ABC transporter substrate-binding protein [Anaerolineae bacterium]|nr:metal ABC transporter substrate-binding protein [Anaerolineae bacterium]
MKRAFIVILHAFLLVIAVHAQEPLNVVATTTIIADVAQNVGGDLVEVTSLVPTNTDIHAFQPVPQDVALVAQADVLLVNGAGLEAFLGDLVENAAGVTPTVVSNGIDVLAFGDDDGDSVGVLGEDADCTAADHAEDDQAEADHDEHDHGSCDPHFWTNPQNVAIWAGNIADALAAADPDHAETYQANAAAYQEQLSALDEEITALLADIPEAQRLIVTNHEFLGYFADHYDFQIVGTVIPSLSTLVEPSPQDVADLIATIQDTGVKAIFVEASDPGRLAEAIAGDVGEVEIVSLYSDALSEPDEPAGTYLDYLRYDAEAIAQAVGD